MSNQISNILERKKNVIYLCENEISIRGEYEQNNIYIQGMETTSLVIFDFANNVWNTSDFTSNVCHTWGLYCWSIKTNRALFNVNWLNQNWVICIFSSIEHLFIFLSQGYQVERCLLIEFYIPSTMVMACPYLAAEAGILVFLLRLPHTSAMPAIPVVWDPLGTPAVYGVSQDIPTLIILICTLYAQLFS